MITYNDVLLAINKGLKAKFPDIPLTAKDITEGFDRPSFFVEFSNIKASDVMNFFKEKTIPVTIYFFPSDRYKNQSELFATLALLEELFLSEPLKVKDDFMINVVDVEGNIEDGVLLFTFDLYLLEEYESHDVGENQELMQELNIKI